MFVNLYYNSLRGQYGGWSVFTAHLYEALKMNGWQPRIYKIMGRTASKARDFGYDMPLYYISEKDAEALEGLNLIVASDKHYKEITQRQLQSGARIVMHDPNELKHCADVLQERPIVIRENNLQFFKDAVFIKHPYVRRYDNTLNVKSKAAVSLSRIDYDKHTDLLLDANRLLSPDRQIEIRGAENRLYTYYKFLQGAYPEWTQDVHEYPKTMHGGTELCRECEFVIDMSAIKKDGGGTQYTFLHAFDAGCALVLNKKWIMSNGTMQPMINCLIAETGQQISDIIMNSELEDVKESLINAGYSILGEHDPKMIGAQYIEELLKRA